MDLYRPFSAKHFRFFGFLLRLGMFIQEPDSLVLTMQGDGHSPDREQIENSRYDDGPDGRCLRNGLGGKIRNQQEKKQERKQYQLIQKRIAQPDGDGYPGVRGKQAFLGREIVTVTAKPADRLWVGRTILIGG